MKNRKTAINIILVVLVVASVLTAALLFGCNKTPAVNSGQDASATDAPAAITGDPSKTSTPSGNGPEEVHDAASDVYNYVEAVVTSGSDGIRVNIAGQTWLSWFGITAADIEAEKAECAEKGSPFDIKVKTTQFKTVKLTEAELEGWVEYIALDGNDQELQSLEAGTLTVSSPVEITYGTRTVSAPMGRYKFQPFASGTLSEAALADGGYKEIVEDSRTEERVVFHYVYHVLVYTRN